ncbi:MAG: C4-dicarboxylate ABC transporter permease [Flammeovirgaceae bacterium]|nr:C4-dicarboxylate ABC transporter permease [Flammeovirgaceae bacterium]
MNSIMNGIQYLIRFLGKIISWSSLILIFIIVTDVFFRYVFKMTSAATFEIEWHLFGLMFLLGAAWTLDQNKHVRVDLFYQRFTPKIKALINLIGTLIFLIPFCWVTLITSIDFVKNSFLLNETSPDPGGLPARYFIKSAIPIGFGLLMLQGILIVLNSIKKLLK